MTYYTYTDGPLGRMLFTADVENLTGLYFQGQKYEALPQADWIEDDHLPVFSALRAQLVQYFKGQRGVFDLPLAPVGTPFQMRVWEALQAIECGTITTYGALARSIGFASSVRAVAAAVGRNPISIVIPCHRVIGGDGSLTGYAGGLERKRALLAIEQPSGLRESTGSGRHAEQFRLAFAAG